MKILVLSDFYPPIIGGMGTNVQTISKELSKRGHKVVVCTTKLSKKESSLEKDDDVKIKRLWGLFQRMPLLYRDINRRYIPPFQDWLITNELKMLVGRMKPDIIHAQGWIMYSALPLIKKYNIPFIVTLHDYGLICPKMTPEKLCEQPLTIQCVSCLKEEYGILKSLLVYSALKINRPKVKEIKRFIAISSFQKTVISRNLGLNNDAVVVISNPIDLKKFSPSACTKELIRRYEKELGVNFGSNKIVHISRLSIDKLSSVLNVIHATPKIITEFPNTQILLVGDGEFFDYVNKIARKIDHRLGKPAIIVTGAIKGEDMPKIIALGDIIIGVGRVALEAMACGKPVIVAGSLIGRYGGNYGGVITPNNVSRLRVHNFSGRNSYERTTPQNIAKDCIRLLADEKCRLSLGRFGREYVEREHDIKDIVNQVEDVYNDAHATICLE
jgi:glycosyltransferase involved in cell wall biosynthesis